MEKEVSRRPAKQYNDKGMYRFDIKEDYRYLEDLDLDDFEKNKG